MSSYAAGSLPAPEHLTGWDAAMAEIASELGRLEEDPALAVTENFAARTAAVDAIEAYVERVGDLAGAVGRPAEWRPLLRRAGALKRRLEQADRRLFRELRAGIRSGGCTGQELARRLRACAGANSSAGCSAEVGYDALDALAAGLLLTAPAPAETRSRAPEMVFYQPTPARVVFDLVNQAGMAPGDVFCDLGSGLGQVVILVYLLTGVRAFGIEYEPAYCAYAARCAHDLGLSEVAFVNEDARDADLSEATVFYMYTPFRGAILRTVLDRLEQVSRARPIRLLTYGPCTLDVAREEWLACDTPGAPGPAHVVLFHSTASPHPGYGKASRASSCP